jgi:hypothetical protein
MCNLTGNEEYISSVSIATKLNGAQPYFPLYTGHENTSTLKRSDAQHSTNIQLKFEITPRLKLITMYE